MYLQFIFFYLLHFYFRIRFGLYFVDFQSANRTRTPKASAIFYKELIKSRKIPEEAEASFAVDKGANFGPPIKTYVLLLSVLKRFLN